MEALSTVSLVCEQQRWKGFQRLQARLSSGTLESFGARVLQCHLLRQEPERERPHGPRRCDWRQAGLFPNRDLGSHDLSEQLSLQGRPLRKCAQKCHQEQLWIYRLPKLCKWRYDTKQDVLNLSWCDFQSVFWHFMASLAIPFRLTLASNQRKRKCSKNSHTTHLRVPWEKSIQQHICTSQFVVEGI